MAIVMTAEEAKAAILHGVAPEGLVVEALGWLSFGPIQYPGKDHTFTRLPDKLTVPRLEIHDCANFHSWPKGLRCEKLLIADCPITDMPEDLIVEESLDLRGCDNITRLTENMSLKALHLQNMTRLVRFPATLTVTERLSVKHCPHLERLPAGLKLISLTVFACEQLTNLPTDLVVDELSLTLWPSAHGLPAGLALKSLVVTKCEYLTTLPAGIQVEKSLTIRSCASFNALPNGLRPAALFIDDCPDLVELPEDLQVTNSLSLPSAKMTSLPSHLRLTGALDVRWCTALDGLPNGLQLHALYARGCTRLSALPDDLRVTQTLDLTDCVNLETLPAGLDVHTLNLTNCTSLRTLPDDLRVTELTISGCTSLTTWPSGGLPPTLRRLVMRDCPSLTAWPVSGPPTLRTLDVRGNAWIRELPSWLRAVDELNVAGCRNLERLPEKLRVASWLDVADTRLRILPPSARGFRLRWRGVAIDARSAFHPEAVNGREILKERNAEVRRVMLERVGYEQFLRQVEAETLDEDEDAGGLRRLLRVAMGQDEPLICLAVHDPSTGRQYLLRTPPAMQTCHQAAAWIAGFDNPDDYHPLAET
ncbi:MAG TPA: hypothetical protein VH349_04105 [Ktedonobacterales bacterium]